MADGFLSLSSEFETATEADWLKAVEKALKGGGLERITRKSDDGITIRPLYREVDFPSATDPLGAQIGGALKNVLAIACGIVEGADLGESARAALISRGLAEMSRLAVAMGGEPETVRGLSGLGDLVLTGTSRQSRNFRYGVALAEGNFESVNAALVEGVYSASVASELAASHGVEMPISSAVARVLEGKLGIPQALEELMSRPITTE